MVFAWLDPDPGGQIDPQKKEIACFEVLDIFFLGLRLLQLGRPS
jgi:hypothetical protein